MDIKGNNARFKMIASAIKLHLQHGDKTNESMLIEFIEKQIDLIKKDDDATLMWLCPKCNHFNMAKRDKCHNCGNEKSRFEEAKY